jgi:probable rRNA maturation factor
MIQYQIHHNLNVFKPSIHLKHQFNQCVRYVDHCLNIKKKLYFDVSFITKQQIQVLNRKYRHINKPTDVLSFPFHRHELTMGLLGEVFICYDIAKKQAKSAIDKEILTLFVHGLLHLLSFDHASKEQTHHMFALQNKIINQVYLIK